MSDAANTAETAGVAETVAAVRRVPRRREELVALLAEHEAGWPSHVTADVATTPALTDAETAERMSGNICRCSAYANIVAAVRDVAKGGRA